MMVWRAASRVYALSLRAFPHGHRRDYSAEMVETFDREVGARRRDRGVWSALSYAAAACLNVVSAGFGERRRYRRAGHRPARWQGGFVRDLLHAVRSLAKARAFTVVCVTSLGVGIGTVIGILTFVRAALGTPADINTTNLVELVVRPLGPLLAQTGESMIETWSYPDYVDVRDGNTGIAISGWSFGEARFQARDGDVSARIATMYVSPNYFATVGVTLARGQGFDPATLDGSPTVPVVIVSDRLWQDRLGSDPGVIGRTIALNRVAHVVVGVTRPRFVGHLGAEAMPDVQVWLPFGAHPRLQGSESVRLDRDVAWVRMHGRLAPDTSRTQATARVAALMSGLAQRYAPTNQFKSASVEPYYSMGALANREVLVAQAMFFGLSGMVLVVVCLNVSGMMMVRSAMRERELAVRLAIGASRARLMQYVLSESVVLAFLGGTLAVAVLFGVPAVLTWWFNWWHPDLDLLVPDVWTYATCVGLCFVASLVFGLLPAIRFSRPTLVTALKDETGGGGRRVGRMHRLTAAIQAGIAVPFLVIGGVKLDQVRTTAAADVGFAPNGLFAASLELAVAGRRAEDAPVLLQRVRDNLARAAGVSSVTVADGVPLDFRYRISRLSREGDATRVSAHVTRVGENFFETMGIRLLRGRTITRDDRPGAELVAVISEPLGARLFSGKEPIGQRITLASEGTPDKVVTIVGVTTDVVTSQMGAARPQMFLPLAQDPVSRVLLIARATGTDEAMTKTFKAAVADVDPDFNPASLTTGPRLVRRSMIDLSTHSAVAILCAGIALTLAALGVYGVVGLMVATRRREIGVRMALGATRPRVLGLVLADSIKVVVPGIAVGLALAIFLVRRVDVAETWYSLGGVEPLAYTVAAAIAMVVALVAGVPSARRAAAVDPILAMRSE